MLDERILKKTLVSAENGDYKFTGVLPNTYTLSISDDGKCWKEPVKKGVLHQIKQPILNPRTLVFFHEFECFFSQWAENNWFYKDNQLHWHFLSILILKPKSGLNRLKQASNFAKMFRIRRFVNSGLVTWSDELVQSFCVWGCQKCWFSTNWTFYFRQFSPKNLDAHRRCKIQGTPRSRHCKRLVFQKKNICIYVFLVLVIYQIPILLPKMG